MAERGAELAELYDLLRAKRKTLGLQKREKELLSKYTPWGTLTKSFRSAFVMALHLGAEIDSDGLLVINNPQTRERLAKMRAVKWLAAKPELISPATRGPKVLFRNLRKWPAKRARRVPPLPLGLTRGGQQDRLGKRDKATRRI